MPIEKLVEFAKDGQKNTDDLSLTDGFPVIKKPARQWFNYLFNMFSLKINELIDLDPIARTEIIDNLTTDDATKPVSAKQAKLLQDNKLDANKRGAANGVASLDENTKVPVEQHYIASTTQNGIVQLVDDLTTGGIDKALTAEQGKLLLAMFASSKTDTGYQKLPSGLILQWSESSGGSTAGAQNVTLPITFPNGILQAVATFNEVNTTTPFAVGVKKIDASTIALRTSSNANVYVRWLAIGW